MEGTRVAVTVDGEHRDGTVVEATYTVKGGSPVVAVELDEPLADGRERCVLSLDETEPI